MNQIEIIYNPYRAISRIVIGNCPIAEHSELARYRQEPFHLWCDKIFDLIANELNDEYELVFTSTFVECEIIKKIGEVFSDCRSIQTNSCTVNLSLQKRFDAFLDQQKSKASYQIHLLATTGVQQMLPTLMATMAPQGGGIYELKTTYRNCSISVHTESSCKFSTAAQTLNVFLSDRDSDWRQLASNCSDGKPMLFICLEDQRSTGFVEKHGNIYCYSCEAAKLQKLILRFLEFACMVPDFRQKFAKLRQTAGKSYATNISMEALDSIDPVIQVFAPPILEVGKRHALTIQVFPTDAPCPELVYDTVPPGIVQCDSGMIEALAPGCTEITVFPKGGVEACGHFSVEAIARNRIVQMAFNQDRLTMPEDEIRQLSLMFQPENADNVDTIQWKSSDVRVVKVKQDGRIKAVAAGNCTIYANAEGIPATCSITVLPVMREIFLADEKLRIHIGESAELTYSFSPANVYDTHVSVKIDDPTIVEYKNGKLLPRCVGKTNITFESTCGSGSATCQVEVGSSFGAKPKGGGFIVFAALLCLFSFLNPGILGICAACAGCLCCVFGFFAGKKTVTLIMILVVLACVLSGGYSAWGLWFI